MDKQQRQKALVLQGFFIFCLLFSLMFSSTAKCNSDETETLTAEQAFTLTARRLDNQKIELNFAIAPGYILYKEHFKFRTLEGHPIDNLAPVFPTPQIKQDEALGNLPIYTKQVTLQIPLSKTNPSKTGLRVAYQGCSDSGFCFAPLAKEVVFSADGTPTITDIETEQFAAIATNNNDHTDESVTDPSATSNNLSVESESDFLTNQLKTGSFPLTFLLFLGLGVLLSFTPCVLPMVPILANILIGENTPLSSSRARLLALVYVLSVSVCYAVAGVFAGMMGSYLQVTLQQPMVLTGLSFVILLFALSQLNLVHIQLPQFFTNALHQIQYKQKQGSILGACAMGFVSALVVSPCVTPALVGALSYIGQTGNAIFGGLALFALAFGMGLPLLTIACIGSRYLPKAGPWMTYIKVITGVLLLVLAGFFFMRAFPKQEATTIVRSTPTHFTTIQSKAELQSALETAKVSGKPVILDVYADWCVSCQQIESEIFENHSVLSSLKDTHLLRLDLTKQTADTQQLQKELAIVGPPTLLFFNVDGEEDKNYRLVGKFKSNDFINHIKHFFTSQNK
jgi:thiol:disulfide interchange protein DsbD